MNSVLNISARPADAPPLENRVIDRLGAVVGSSGFQPVPDVLLFHQKELGLRSEDLNVLLHITAHWYWPDQMPFPRATTIAKRMGVSSRSVQRSLHRLREKKLIGRTKNADGRAAYDLRPLVEKLEPYARNRLAARMVRRGPEIAA